MAIAGAEDIVKLQCHTSFRFLSVGTVPRFKITASAEPRKYKLNINIHKLNLSLAKKDVNVLRKLHECQINPLNIK